MQKAFSFDKVTLQKISKGLWLAVYPTLAVSAITGLEYLHGYFTSEDTLYTTIAAYLLQTAINVIKEYMKGE